MTSPFLLHRTHDGSHETATEHSSAHPDAAQWRIGVLGSGRIARVHAEALKMLGGGPDLVYSRNESRRNAFARDFACMPVVSERELVEESDLVLICSPTPWHAPQIRGAIDAGCRVIAEKPLARTASQLDEIREIDAASPGRLFVAHSSRYLATAIEARRLIRSGGIGAPTSIEITRLSKGPSPTEHTWFFDLDSSGGVVLDAMVHDIDMALDIAGDAELVDAVVTSLPARGQRAYLQLMHASGVTSTLTGVWDATREGDPEVTAKVSGDEGEISFSMLAWGNVVLNGNVVAESAETQVHVFARQLDDALAFLRTARVPRTSVADADSAVRIALAALAHDRGNAAR